MIFRDCYGRLYRRLCRKKMSVTYDGRLPNEPSPVLEGPHNASPRREPWTPTQKALLLFVAVMLLLVIPLTTDVQRFWSLLP